MNDVLSGWVIGIDPGKKGGIAVVRIDLSKAKAWRCPPDLPSMAALAREIVEDHAPTRFAMIEKVSSMPRDGVRSAFSFGENYGAWRGILSALRLPYHEVTPTKWQNKVFDSASKRDRKTRKAQSLELARRLFPYVDLRFKADDGKADALLLAYYGVLTRLSPVLLQKEGPHAGRDFTDMDRPV